MISRFSFSNLRLFSSHLRRLSANDPPGTTPPPPPNIFELMNTSMVAEEETEDDGKLAPEDATILLFAGQGAQQVGMVKDLLKYENVPEMFDVASQIFNADLLQACQQGPQSELDRTYICQPTTFLTSLAGVEKIQHERPDILENCRAAAGFSVGEFAALVFSGALDFEDALRMIKVRAEAMQRASDKTNSELVTCLGKSSTKFKYACLKAREYCHSELQIEDPVCHVTANLAPNLVTVGGHTEAIDFLRGNAKEFNIRKIINIPVSGAFHTDLMAPAKYELRAAIRNIDIEKPLIDVYSNLTGKKYQSALEIKSNLPLQVVRPVLWEKIVSKMIERPKSTPMPAFYEVGPGGQLGSLLRMCNGKAYKGYTNVSSIG